MLKKIIKNLCPDFILDFYIEHLYESIDRTKKRIKYSKLIKETALHYKEVEKIIQNRKTGKLRFASYVEYDASFSAYGLIELMLQQPNLYSAKIVVVPDITRGNENLISQYKQTKKFFTERYGKENVLDGYDIENDKYLDLSDQFDIINLSNPYDEMVHEFHGVKYLSTKNVLPVYISYGCLTDKYCCNVTIPLLETSLFWKVFADNKYSVKDYKKYELSRGKNVSCTGYVKMDNIAKVIPEEKNKKTVIIAPHHTINNPALPLSNFLNYYDFILELPSKYPDIQFVFRPHPLLYVNLVNEKLWTCEELEEYKRKIQEAGIIYSYGGNYFDTFVNSDAIIHDCSSFIMEYLFTGHPCCFVGNKNFKKIFSKLGKACLKNYYLAFSKEEILHFIDEVVINNNDYKKEIRNNFTEKHLKLNYPNVSKIILKDFDYLMANK